MKKFETTLLVAILCVAGMLPLAGCNHPPTTLTEFADADAAGTPIQCGELVATYSRGIPDQNDLIPLVTYAQFSGLRFRQCHAELEADRHARCTRYAASLRQGVDAGDPVMGAHSGVLDLDGWADICPTEIHQAVADVADPFKIDQGGRNPILYLPRENISLAMAGIQTMQVDSTLSSSGLWRVKISTAKATYSLWYSSLEKAIVASDRLHVAWLNRPAAQLALR